MSAARRRLRPGRATVVAAVLASLAPAVRADTYRATDADLITSVFGDGHDSAYKGPRVFVQGQSVNRDTYECAHFTPGVSGPVSEKMNNWVAVADDLQTSNLSFTSTGNLSPIGSAGPSVSVITWNWSDTTAHIRVVTSCTNNIDGFPTHYSYGDYNRAWVAGLKAGSPDFVCLVHSAFWFSTCGRPADQRAFAAATAPIEPVTPAARPAGNTFALRNGSNTLALSFRHPRTSLRPPAICYSTSPAKARCVARRLHVPVSNGHGYVQLVLRCAGLKPGASAKLRIRPAIRRTFRLRQGAGSGHVHLDKPPGSVKPLVFLGTRPATAPCTIRSRQTRMASRTMDLRIVGHCGRVKPGTVGELAVGGLLAEDPRQPVPQRPGLGGRASVARLRSSTGR